jgi:hypothetical protein
LNLDRQDLVSASADPECFLAITADTNVAVALWNVQSWPASAHTGSNICWETVAADPPAALLYLALASVACLQHHGGHWGWVGPHRHPVTQGVSFKQLPDHQQHLAHATRKPLQQQKLPHVTNMLEHNIGFVVLERLQQTQLLAACICAYAQAPTDPSAECICAACFIRSCCEIFVSKVSSRSNQTSRLNDKSGLLLMQLLCNHCMARCLSV